MKGLRQYKKRNAGQNERRAVWSAFAAAAKTYELKRVLREDLRTREVTETSRSKMNREIFWFETFEPMKNRLALPQSVAWEEMETGASLYTEEAKFWIENARIAPIVKPFTATLEYGNRKGLDFKETEKFATEREGIGWLEEKAAHEMCPSGVVTNEFGRIVYQLSEVFELMK